MDLMLFGYVFALFLVFQFVLVIGSLRVIKTRWDSINQDYDVGLELDSD